MRKGETSKSCVFVHKEGPSWRAWTEGKATSQGGGYVSTKKNTCICHWRWVKACRTTPQSKTWCGRAHNAFPMMGIDCSGFSCVPKKKFEDGNSKKNKKKHDPGPYIQAESEGQMSIRKGHWPYHDLQKNESDIANHHKRQVYWKDQKTALVYICI